MSKFKYAKLDKSKPSSNQPSIEDEREVKPVETVKLTDLTDKDLDYFEEIQKEVTTVKNIVEVNKVARVQKSTVMTNTVRKFEPINVNRDKKLVTFPKTLAKEVLTKLKNDKATKKLIAKVEEHVDE